MGGRIVDCNTGAVVNRSEPQMTSLSMHTRPFRTAERPLSDGAPMTTMRVADAARAPGRPWSIDDEPMGPGWHDSSRMLRRGLDVIEGAPLHALPAEWRWLAWVQ
jgi:hypothetical protein